MRSTKLDPESESWEKYSRRTMSPAWTAAARESRRSSLSGRRPRWVRSALRRQTVALDIAVLETSPGMALALPHVAADAAGVPARAKAVADRAAAEARRIRWRVCRMIAVSGDQGLPPRVAALRRRKYDLV